MGSCMKLLIFASKQLDFEGRAFGGVRTCPFSCGVRLQNERCWKRVWAFHRKRMLEAQGQCGEESDERDGKIRI